MSHLQHRTAPPQETASAWFQLRRAHGGRTISNRAIVPVSSPDPIAPTSSSAQTARG